MQIEGGLSPIDAFFATMLIGSRCIARGVEIEGISDRWLFATVPENVRRIRFNRSRTVACQHYTYTREQSFCTSSAKLGVPIIAINRGLTRVSVSFDCYCTIA